MHAAGQKRVRGAGGEQVRVQDEVGSVGELVRVVLVGVVVGVPGQLRPDAGVARLRAGAVPGADDVVGVGRGQPGPSVLAALDDAGVGGV